MDQVGQDYSTAYAPTSVVNSTRVPGTGTRVFPGYPGTGYGYPLPGISAFAQLAAPPAARIRI